MAFIAEVASSSCSCAEVRSLWSCSELVGLVWGGTCFELEGLEFFVFCFDCCVLFLDCSLQLIHLFLKSGMSGEGDYL